MVPEPPRGLVSGCTVTGPSVVYAGGALTLPRPSAGLQGSFCMLCVMQNHIVQAFANSGNAIKPVSFIRDLRSEFWTSCL